MGKIFSRGKSIKNLIQALSKLFHVSSSTFGILYFDYFLKIVSINNTDVSDLIYNSNLDIKYSELIQKEIERSLRK